MSEVVMHFPSNNGDKQSKLALDKGLRDAVGDLLRARWPQGTVKNAAREYKISLAQAKHAVNSEASITTIEAILKRGGLPLALQIVEQVTGQSIARYFVEMRQAHEEQGKRAAALVWASRTGDRPGGADPDPMGAPQAEWSDADRRRAS